VSEIHPSSEGYELLKQFCILIGEGRIEPKEDPVHHILLYHPIKDELLLVHSDWPDRQIFIREFPEDFGAGSLEGFPLIHTLYVRGMPPIFPFVVDIHSPEEEATYHYAMNMGTASVNKIPLAQYNRLKRLFDEKNPVPWTEREDPAHLLTAPVNPT